MYVIQLLIFIPDIVYIGFLGQKEDLWLVGVFHMSFTIDDLPGERIYVVSLNMSECFEDGQPCNTTIVLNKTRLPKDLCVMDNSYYIASKFNL